MTADTIISPEDLVKEGWENTGLYFGDCQIWRQAEKRLLYEPKNNRVYKVYSM